jgi:hypothetical protein
MNDCRLLKLKANYNTCATSERPTSVGIGFDGL